MTAANSSPSPSDRPVVLIHGFGSSTEALWRKAGWIDAFEAAGRMVIGVDLPGHGTEKNNVERDPADVLLALAAEHGPIDAVGFSAGSWAVLTAAGEQPELFHRIAVLGAADVVLTQSLHTREMQAPMIAAILTAEAPKDNPMASVILGLIAEAGNDPEAVAGYLRTDKRFCTRESLAAITSPTLVVEGVDDMAGSSALVSQAIPNGELLSIPGAGHFDIPAREQTRAAVTAFLNQGG
ncbi:alpha/beta fold hydrolase [Streptomyces sp. NPDC020965]|uniref:alpha/beta fold hydrolase n=1 Tax=Streptomyces sp. NPDC020965 TaxID=3365105 RepID=UPI00379DD646